MAEITDAELARFKRIEEAAQTLYEAPGDRQPLGYRDLKQALKPVYEPLVSREELRDKQGLLPGWRTGALYLRRAADRLEAKYPDAGTTRGTVGDYVGLEHANLLREWADAEEKL